MLKLNGTSVHIQVQALTSFNGHFHIYL